MKIAIVIPFHKEKEKLDKCIEAVQKSIIPVGLRDTPVFNYEIIVEDDSVSENGFTKTVNAGIKKAFAKACGYFEYILVLNQDCYLAPDALQNLVAFMGKHPKCAITGLKQLSSEDNDRIIHGGTKQCFPAGVHEIGLVSKKDCNKSKKVPWVNGAAMFIDVNALVESGLLDENMKMFGSDSDLSMTLRSRGWECWYCAEAVCIHEQISSRLPSEKMQKQLKLDMLYFKDKWISGELFEDLTLELLD